METNMKTELDALIEEALRQPPEIPLPEGFTDRMVASVARHYIWKETLKDFLYKCLIGLGALAVFSIVFFFVAIQSPDILAAHVKEQWKFVAVAASIGFFVLFTDQVVLRYLFRCSRTFA